MIVLLKLLLVHFVFDFVVQSGRQVREKETLKIRSVWLYVHTLQHGVFSWLLVWSLDFAPYAAVIALSHFVIDIIKLYGQTELNKRIVFFIDQFCHLAVIGVLWYFWVDPAFNKTWLSSEKYWAYGLSVVFLTVPSSVVVQKLISIWTPHTEGSNYGSLANAGKYIGILERLFVFVFLTGGHRLSARGEIGFPLW